MMTSLNIVFRHAIAVVVASIAVPLLIVAALAPFLGGASVFALPLGCEITLPLCIGLGLTLGIWFRRPTWTALAVYTIVGMIAGAFVPLYFDAWSVGWSILASIGGAFTAILYYCVFNYERDS